MLNCCCSLLLRFPLCLLQSTPSNVLVHAPVDLDNDRRPFAQEPRKKPLHESMTPVRCACECNVLCASRPTKLAQRSLDKLLGVGNKCRRLADLRHGGSNEMGLHALNVYAMGL